MTFTHPTETRYRSPSGTEQRAAARGQFKPTLPPLPAELPEGVGAYLACLNRRERRRFAAKARAHAATRRENRETFERADGATVEVDRERGTATVRVTGSEAVARAYRDALVFGTGVPESATDGAHIPELGLTVVADDGTPTVPLTEGLKAIYDPREIAKLVPKGWRNA